MAAAGLWTTASDLARFAIGMQKMLRGDAGPLSPAAARDMITPRKERYGLGLVVEAKGGGTYFTHGAPGSSAKIVTLGLRVRRLKDVVRP